MNSESESENSGADRSAAAAGGASVGAGVRVGSCSQVGAGVEMPSDAGLEQAARRQKAKAVNIIDADAINRFMRSG